MNLVGGLTAIVCALGAAACAGGETPAHATAAVAVAESGADLVVRVRGEAGVDPVENAAVDVVRRSLAEQGFAVTSDASVDADADILVRARGAAGGVVVVTLEGRLGARRMVPITALAESNGALEEASLVDASLRFERRVRRHPLADRHFLDPR